MELTMQYKVAFILKLNGFGNSVLQRLIKTSIKKNLYYEIKDKVIEERYNGTKVYRNTQKTKVYGLDSTKEIRARLIEILYERVQYHKDKFIAPILHDEMQSMEVKKSGKVEHCSNSHDDQVFSYLMALYVWYDGQNLMERYNLMKNSIMTDDDLEEAVIPLEDKYGDQTAIDLDASTEIVNEELRDQLELLEKAQKQTLFYDFEKDQFTKDNECLSRLLQTNPAARQAYVEKNHLDPDDPSLGGMLNSMDQQGIPDSFFISFNDKEDEYDVYSGNLGSTFKQLFNNDSIF